ncbi:MAG: hypothetical protein JWL94_576 [Microbacteriaceae bacterium]|jgi:6-phosphogluconolactonase|nr:hypothetical protein [Microbacteriaceae bacterium]
MTAQHLFVGCYTASMGGDGDGITVFPLTADGLVDVAGHDGLGSGEAELSVAATVLLESPSFLAVSEDRLFAVTEGGEGQVASFTRSGTRLDPVSTVPSGGADPCFVTFDGERLLVANYSSGSLAVLAVNPDASLGEARVAVAPAGSGPVTDRQEAPHVHQAIPSGPGRVISSDLGGDRVLEYAIGDGAPELVGAHPLPAGTGPRHMAWAHGALLVVGELDSRLHVLRKDLEHGALVHHGSVSTIDTEVGDMISQPSHLAVSPHERFAYVANRGRNTVSVFDLSRVAAGGLPERVQETLCGGDWPRHFALHAGRLYVANQGSGDISVFDTDAASGLIGDLLQSVPTGSPTCLVFV